MNEVFYVSIILQMAIDGQTKLDYLHPALKEFIEGMLEEFDGVDNQEAKDKLFFTCTNALNQQRCKLN